jgi:hypothetical protein
MFSYLRKRRRDQTGLHGPPHALLAIQVHNIGQVLHRIRSKLYENSDEHFLLKLSYSEKEVVSETKYYEN